MGTSLGTALVYHGRIDEGLAYSARHWEPVRKAAVPVVMAVMGHELSLVLALARNVSQAAEWGERIVPEVVKASPVFESMLWRPLAWIYGLSGDVAKGEQARQAIERIEAETRLGCIYEDAAGLGFLYLRRGEWDTARGYLEQGVSLYQERGNLSALNGCSLVLGNLCLETEDLGRAEVLLRRCTEMARHGGNVLVELWALPLLAELYTKTGAPERAHTCLERGFGLLASDRAWYGLPGPLLVARGLLAVRQQQWDEALEAFNRAVAIGREHRLPHDTARALYEGGRAQAMRGRPGDREAARVRIGESLQIFQTIKAAKDVERVTAGKELVGA
jgi:tetratricopeptide (TPR) repeat protein